MYTTFGAWYLKVNNKENIYTLKEHKYQNKINLKNTIF